MGAFVLVEHANGMQRELTFLSERSEADIIGWLETNAGKWRAPADAARCGTGATRTRARDALHAAN